MCTICKREFSGLNSLKKHIPIHTRKIQHKCDVCGYVFGKKEYLLDHMRKHTGKLLKLLYENSILIIFPFCIIGEVKYVVKPSIRV